MSASTEMNLGATLRLESSNTDGRQAPQLTGPQSPLCMSLLKIVCAAHQEDFDRAVVLARRNAERKRDDAKTQIQLGETLLADQQLQEAEQAFLRAVELAPDQLVTHSKLFDFYLRSNQSKRAREVLDQLEQAPYFSRAVKAVAVARGHYFLRDRSAAAVEIRDALEEDPESVLLRRMLGDILAGGRETVAESRQIYEQLVQESPNPADADVLILGRLYETEQQFDKAQAQYQTLADRSPPHRLALVALINLLLRNDQFSDADGWLNKLETTAVASLGAVMLRARWLHGMGRTGEIKPLIEPFAGQLLKTDGATEQQLAQLCVNLGSFYVSVEQEEAARAWYRRAMDFSSEEFSRSVLALLKSGRTSDAVQSIED